MKTELNLPGTGWQVCTSSKQIFIPSIFPPLLSFIGTNQIGDCAAYLRGQRKNRVDKIKLATAFVFGVDVRRSDVGDAALNEAAAWHVGAGTQVDGAAVFDFDQTSAG